MKFPKEEGLNVKKDRKPERQPGNTLEKNEYFSFRSSSKELYGYENASLPGRHYSDPEFINLAKTITLLKSKGAEPQKKYILRLYTQKM